MCKIELESIGRDIILKPIEIVMRDQAPDSIEEINFNLIVKLHPIDGTHCVLAIRRYGGEAYYFDSFGIEAPPIYLEEYIDLGSDERIREYAESYCSVYCLFMIYLID